MTGYTPSEYKNTKAPSYFKTPTSLRFCTFLSEEVLECLLNLGNRNEADAQLAVLQAVHIALGDDDSLKSQLGSLRYALLYAAHGADLARQAHLTRHADGAVNGNIQTAGQDGADYGQVYCRIAYLEPSGYVQEHILLPQLEAHTFLKYGQQHVHAAHIKSDGTALRSSVNGGACQRLNLDQERTHALNRACYRYTAHALMTVGKQQLAGVIHLSETILTHLIYTQFGCTAKPVLDGSQYPVQVVLVSFKLQHRSTDHPFEAEVIADIYRFLFMQGL